MTSTPYSSATAPVFTALDAHRDGWSAQKLADKVRGGEIIRIAKSCYVGMAEFRALHPEQRHVLRLEATLPTFGFPVVASHYSALALHDVPIWGADLSRLHVARIGAGARYSRRSVAVHPSYGPPELVVIEGLRAVHPTIAVLGTAMVCGIESGVIAADAALAKRLTTIDHLHEWLDRMAGFPKMSRARRAVELAEPLTESPGESRTRLVLNTLDLGPVRPQVEIYDEFGAFVARVDFLLPRDRLIVEFDGLVKYGPNDAREAIIAEKIREDRLRALGYGIARVVWKDFDVAGRIETKVRRGRGAANASR